MAKAKVIKEMLNSNRNTKVTVGSPYERTAILPGIFTWNSRVMIHTEMIMNTAKWKYHAAQYSQPFIPIIFIDS